MATEMPKTLRRWESVRQQGKLRFILQSGVLAWGLPMFVVMTFVVNRRADRPQSTGVILVSAAIWAAGGVLFGWTVWTISERRYQKFLASQKRE